MKAVIQFSGGKDSTALLYWMRDQLDGKKIVHCNTGAILPEVEDFISKTCSDLGADLDIIKTDVFAYTSKMGYPSDIVPFERTIFYKNVMHGQVEQPLQSYAECCMNMIWLPFQRYFQENSIDTVYRGSKGTDTRVGVPDGFTEDGITYYSPLWNWSHDDVFAFLKKQGVVLPKHYSFFADSLDCWICTGHLKHCGKERLQYIKKYHPEKWPFLRERLSKVEQILYDELMQVYSALETTDG